MINTIKLSKSLIGENQPCFIIAEAGVNHNGDIEIALELIRQAKSIGADCVKFQTFKTENIITSTAPKAAYQLKVTDPAESQFDMLKKLELDYDAYKRLISLCRELDIIFLSTPYSEEDADFLEDLGVEGFKIASGQLVELAFLEHIAHKNKPMIISTGMATLAEVNEAVETIRTNGNEKIIVLQCTTNYPSAIEDTNLRAMNAMANSLNVMVGYSDHVENNMACFASVALGACVVEKHFTLDRNLPGPDHSSSLDPSGFHELIVGIRNIEKAMGSPVKKPTDTEKKNITGMRRSIVAVRDLPAGTMLQKDDLLFKRPAMGLAPRLLKDIIGKKTAMDITKDSILQYASIIWE